MPILYLFYHKSLVQLKSQIQLILPEEKWVEKWKYTFGYQTVLFDGFRLSFKEDTHCLGIGFGTNRISNTKGLSKEETKIKVNKIFDLLITKEDFSEYPCGESNCKKYDFSFSNNKNKKAEKRKKENSPLSQQTERPKKKVDLIKNKLKNKRHSNAFPPPPPSTHLLDIQVDNSAETEFKQKIKELLFENNPQILLPELLLDVEEDDPFFDPKKENKKSSSLLPNDSIRKLFKKVMNSPNSSKVLNSPEANEMYKFAIGEKKRKKKIIAQEEVDDEKYKKLWSEENKEKKYEKIKKSEGKDSPIGTSVTPPPPPSLYY